MSDIQTKPGHLASFCLIWLLCTQPKGWIAVQRHLEPAPSWKRYTWLPATLTHYRAAKDRSCEDHIGALSTSYPLHSSGSQRLVPWHNSSLSKWTISSRVTQAIHSVWQSFTCKYFIFLLNIFGWLWILDVMRTLLCMKCRKQQGLSKEEKHPSIKNKVSLHTTN